jgi:hypothetical protein
VSLALHGAAMANSTMQLHSREDVVLAAPLMLGYWPGESVCAIFVDHDDHVHFVMRWDLAPTPDDGTPADLPLPPLAAPGEELPAGFHLVAYLLGESPDHADVDWWVDAARSLEASGIPRGRVLVAARRDHRVVWRSVSGTPDGCHDASEADVRETDIDRAAKRRGLPRILAGRAEFVADVAADEVAASRIGEALSAVGHAQVVGEDGRDDAIRAVRRLLTARVPTDLDFARALVALLDIRVRDTVLWDVMHEDPGTWTALAARLATMVSAAPESHVSAPATLLSILRWQMGDGSRASAAVERALAADPGYTLAQLVQQCLACGMHPAIWREGLQDLSREDCRRTA